MQEQIFLEFSIILFTSLIVSILMRQIKQPVMVGYIVAGLILGPTVLNLVTASDSMNSMFSQLGVAFLLFMVGLNLNPQSVKETGGVASITGISQVIFTTVIGFLLCLLLGFDSTEAIYIALGLSFSSTIVILKLLSEKRDTETLYGSIAIGFLIIQDIIAMLILMGVSSLSSGGDLLSTLIFTVLKGVALIIILVIVSKKILPIITKKLAKNQEILFLFSFSWCLALASIFYLLNFSIEIGALVAGITLSLSPYRYEISAKMKPLRDFFIMLFFVLLGSHLHLENITNNLIPVILLSALVLLGNPIIVLFIMGRLGYTKRTAFQAGLTVAQISEFSLILLTLGVKLGHVNNDILSLLTMIGIITIIGSTYFIIYSDTIYNKIEKYLTFFEKKGTPAEQKHAPKNLQKNDLILLGYSKLGSELLENIQTFAPNYLVVDYDPRTIHYLSGKNINCLYGDISNSHIFDELSFENTKMVISTMKHFDTNILVAHKIREINQSAILIGVAHHVEEAIRLYEEGFNYVIMPSYLSGSHAAAMISELGYNLDKFSLHKQEQVRKLLLKRQINTHARK